MKRILASCFLSSLVFLSILSAAIPHSERQALIALYQSTDGDNWIDKAGWKTPPLHTDGFALPGTEEGWRGVTLRNHRVIEIILNLNKLSGSIPESLGDLRMISSLDLSRNQLY